MTPWGLNSQANLAPMGLVAVIHVAQPPRSVEVRIDDSPARLNAFPCMSSQSMAWVTGTSPVTTIGALLETRDYLLRSSYKSRQSGLASTINCAFQERE